jgi:hypothetical protein
MAVGSGVVTTGKYGWTALSEQPYLIASLSTLTSPLSCSPKLIVRKFGTDSGEIPYIDGPLPSFQVGKSECGVLAV